MFELMCILALLFVSLIAGNLTQWFKRWVKGYVGEATVRRQLAAYCKNRNAFFLNNVTLGLNDGSTTQIDHILITASGIFVVETKHYDGWIFCNPSSKTWTQVLYKVKNQFQNPIFQNYKHLKAVLQAFNYRLGAKQVHNIVVFTGKAEFKTEMPSNVLYAEELISTIECFSDEVLSMKQIHFCVDRLENLSRR